MNSQQIRWDGYFSIIMLFQTSTDGISRFCYGHYFVTCHFVFPFTVLKPSWNFLHSREKSLAQCIQSVTLDCWLSVFSIKLLNCFFNKDDFIMDPKKLIQLAKSDKHCLGKRDPS